MSDTPVAVVGPYDLQGAIRRALPRALPIIGGEMVPSAADQQDGKRLEWFLQDEPPTTPPAPSGKPLAYPHGVFRILSDRPIGSPAAVPNEPYRMVLQSKQDAIPFVANTLDYEVTEQDVESVQGVTGTLGGAGGHVFLVETDFTFDADGIHWTGTGDLPDDGTPFTVAYRHRMYHPRRLMLSRLVVRATVKAKEFRSAAGRHYPMTTLSTVLGKALEMDLRSRSGNDLVRPAQPGGSDEPYPQTVSLGRVLAAGPSPVEPSGSVAGWFVDFQLNVGGIFEYPAIPAIRKVPFEVEIG